MTTADVPAVAVLARETFWDLGARSGAPEPPPSPIEGSYPRYRHLVETDPGGAWVDEVDGELRGAALALLREGLWGLSLLVVSPAHQSGGIGRSLLQNTLDYGRDSAAGVILASEDARALRAYSRAGFAMRPAMDAFGLVRKRPPAEPAVRALRWPEDGELVDETGRFLRGAGHGRDVPAWRETGAAMYAHDGGGFAVRAGGSVKVVAARTPDVAAAVLRAVLRDVPDGEPAEVMFVTAGQEWAVSTLLEAGLGLRPAGALMVRGEPGPLAPYLPSGAYL